MPNAQGPGLCSTSVDKKDDHVCSMLVHVVCCNFFSLGPGPSSLLRCPVPIPMIIVIAQHRIPTGHIPERTEVALKGTP